MHPKKASSVHEAYEDMVKNGIQRTILEPTSSFPRLQINYKIIDYTLEAWSPLLNRFLIGGKLVPFNICDVVPIIGVQCKGVESTLEIGTIKVR